MATAVVIWIVAGLHPMVLSAIECKEATTRAYEQYVRQAEQRTAARLQDSHPFLWSDDLPDRHARVLGGHVVSEASQGTERTHIPGGLIHDWTGAVFVRGATLARTIACIQNYDRHSEIYKPEVLTSRLQSHTGDVFHVYLRFLITKFMTVVLDTENEVRYFPIDDTRAYSRSYTRQINEVIDAGTTHEHKAPAGNDSGYLWRLDSFWRFQQRDGGVYVEAEVISLTRDVPLGLGPLFGPLTRTLPQESLVRSLEQTRRAVQATSGL
jgi:hypothetical protein